ncbi:hypothetical protein [Nocardia sp. NPDC004260]
MTEDLQSARRSGLADRLGDDLWDEEDHANRLIVVAYYNQIPLNPLNFNCSPWSDLTPLNCSYGVVASALWPKFAIRPH